MFNTAVTRLLWKELRAQQAVWIAMAAELVLLQFWWGTIGHKSIDLNLLSMAFVLTGVFAMTSSALLFAGESEAKTDLFLRQMPFRQSDLIRGKLLFVALAVAAFLVFSLITTFIAGQMAGRYGGDITSPLGDPALFGTSIIGMWAWGLFYSLLTRKVVWTVVGAALTEIFMAGFVHSGILADLYLPEWTFYLVYLVIVLSVLVADARLLQRWCSGEMADLRSSKVTETAVVRRIPEAPLPWLSAFHWSSITGAVTSFYVLLMFVLISSENPTQGLDGGSILVIFGGSTLLGVITAFAISRWKTQWAAIDRVPSQPELRLLDHPFTLRRVGSILGIAGLSSVAFVLGLVAGYTALAFPLTLFVDQSPIAMSPHWSETLAFLLTAVGCISALWLGTQWLKTGSLRGTGGWLSLLQTLATVRSRTVRRISPLLWIEARRALPILLGGWVLLTLIGIYCSEHPDRVMLSYLAMTLAALFCGLMTILPDRTQGTLAFLTERGVSPMRVLGIKAILWGCTLALLMIPPLLIQGRVFRLMVEQHKFATEYYQTRFGQDLPSAFRTGDMYTLVDGDHRGYLISLLGGSFLIGILTAAWIRRPILAGLAGFMLMIVWLVWIQALLETSAPVLFPALIPQLLIGIGFLWTAKSVVLEQTSWRAKLGQVSWGLLIAFVSLQGYFHFRAHEIPDVSNLIESIGLRNGQPSPLGQQTSSWLYPFDSSISHASQLDAMVDDNLKRSSLIQPQRSVWGAPNSFQIGIAELKLDDEGCDLDAAFEHLRKWHQLTELMAQASRNEDGWVDCLFARRVVLSAIRRWANHPKQTAERLEAALAKIPTRLYTTSGATVLAREYADAHRALETGISVDVAGTQYESGTSPVTRWFLTRYGEKERVRRLIDFYYHLSASTTAAGNPTEEDAYLQWMRTTHLSALAFGVELPWDVLNVRHRGQVFIAGSAEAATRLVLQLQILRLKQESVVMGKNVDELNRFHQEVERINSELTIAGKNPIDRQVDESIQARFRPGPFPESFAELLTSYPQAPTNDVLTNERFGYEPRGFDREFLASPVIEIAARQPILYSLGLGQPRGVELKPTAQGELFYQTRTPAIHRPSHPFLPTSAVTAFPANPNAIRFVILGEMDDEDGLYRPDAPQEPATEVGAGGNSGGMGSAMGGAELPPESAPEGVPLETPASGPEPAPPESP